MLGGTAGPADQGRGDDRVRHGRPRRDGIVREVRRQIKYGVDWIKVMVTGLIPSVKGPEVKVWNKREMQAVVDTAHELNTPVVGHCRNSHQHQGGGRGRDGPDLPRLLHGRRGARGGRRERLGAVPDVHAARQPRRLRGEGRHGPRAAGRVPGRARRHRRHDRQGAPGRRAGDHRLGDRLRDHPVRRVARPRAGDARAVRRLLADGGDPGGDVPGRLGDEDGGPGRRPAGGAASPTSSSSTATRWPTSRSWAGRARSSR